jgi:uncharacterized protein
MIAIADTSFVLAAGNRNEAQHQQCAALFKVYQKIVLPQSTLAELGYMLGSRGGNRAVVHFLRLLPTMPYSVEPLLDEDLQRTADLLEKYADARIDFVDASIASVAERLNIIHILTLDQRDFKILRPTHTSRFELLPVLQ